MVLAGYALAVGNTEPTCTAKAMRLLVLLAAKHGIQPAVVLAPFGIDAASLEDPDAQVPIAWVQQAWTTVPELVGDPDLGLHAAEIAAARPSHVIDYIGAYARTPREFFESLLRLRRILNDSSTHFTLEVDGRVASLSRHGIAPAQLVACVVAQFILFVRRRRRDGLPLRRAMFRHARPDSTREYERIFQCDVEFGAERDGIELDASLLDVELDGSDTQLLSHVQRHGEALLAALPKEATSVEARLRRRLLTLQPGSNPTIEESARELGMSARSLQRQLQVGGVTFKRVVEDLRHETSLTYLRDRQHSISEVAFLTGFADVSAFSRAFRRWTGSSPLDWRRENLAATT